MNFIKPNGLVAAASITSHTSTPRRSHMIASSLTRPMLIMRKVFSSSFAISAASAEETVTTVLIAPSYQAVATSTAGFGDAAHHLGRVDRGPVFAARVHALGGEAEEPVLADLQAGFLRQLWAAAIRASCRDRWWIPAQPPCPCAYTSPVPRWPK